MTKTLLLLSAFLLGAACLSSGSAREMGNTVTLALPACLLLLLGSVRRKHTA